MDMWLLSLQRKVRREVNPQFMVHAKYDDIDVVLSIEGSSEAMEDPPATIKATKNGGSPKPIRELPKPPGQDSRSPKRHKKSLSVSFSQLPPKLHKYKKRSSSPRRSCPCSCKSCCLCFQYASLVVLGIAFVIVLFASLFLTYIHSRLPEIKIERLTIPRLNTSYVDQQLYLSADVDLFVDAFNKNEKIWISYDPIEVSVSSGNVGLGQATIPGFLHNTDNMTVLKVHTKVSNSMVDNEEGATLMANFNDKSLVLNVVLTSNVGLNHPRLKLKGLPVVIKCSSITLSRIAHGVESKCDVNLLTLWYL